MEWLLGMRMGHAEDALRRGSPYEGPSKGLEKAATAQSTHSLPPLRSPPLRLAGPCRIGV